MPNIAPSPSSSSSGEDNGSDKSSSKGAPPSPGSSSSSNSPPNWKGESSPPPSPSSSGGSRSSEESSSSSPPSPSGNSPPSRSSPSPSSQPSSSNGGNSKSPPPPSPPPDSSPSKGISNSSQNSGNSNSSPPPGSKSPSPPQRSGGSSPSPPSPSSSEAPPTESGESSSSSSPRALPPRSSPPSPLESSNNNDQSNSEPSPGNNPESSPPSPPPPTNTSVVFIPVPVRSNGRPGALPPPGTVAISPGSSVVTTTNLPGSSQSTNAGSHQVPAGSSGTSNSGDGFSTNSDTLSQSSRVGTSHVAAAIAGATITGLMFVVVAVVLVVSRRKKKRSTDGIVYVNGGGGANNQSGMLYHQPPPGASAAGFSYGPAPTPDNNAGGGGYYQSGIMESNKSSFSYEELTSITSNFSRDNVIGEGGFGCVFKGWLGDGKCVAVKQLKAGSGQGEREFQAEVEIISRVHHRHLVSLVGYCVAAHHRMLIYEFVPNGTMEHHLHGRGVPVMDWPTRLRIAIGAAKGLAYLHEDCHPRIIHRDIKSANILLDYSFEAQVADFGLAKLCNDTNTHVSTRIMGTFGYLAPEYASSGKLTDRSDVFSFGVVLLELITGRKPVDQTRPLGEESLVEWARPVLSNAVETGDLDALVDPRLDSAYNRGEMMVMVEAAAACVRHSAPKRPRMVQVMRALDDDAGGMSDLSNGVKVGQSRAYGSGSHVAAIQQLRLTAFASEEFTGEYEQSREYGSSDSETRPINQRRLG